MINLYCGKFALRLIVSRASRVRGRGSRCGAPADTGTISPLRSRTCSRTFVEFVKDERFLRCLARLPQHVGTIQTFPSECKTPAQGGK